MFSLLILAACANSKASLHSPPSQTLHAVSFPTGHLLGLSHDDSKFCEERFGVNSDKRLMSSILTSIDASKPWSRCTSATITDFFDDGNGERGRLQTLAENFSQTEDVEVIFSIDTFVPHSATKSCLLTNKAVISESYLQSY